MISANQLAADAVANKQVCVFPEESFVEEPIVPVDGVVYTGIGSHMPSASQNGSVLKPAAGYYGPAFELPRAVKCSNTVMRDFRVDGFQDDGFKFTGELAAGFNLDNVAALRCANNGFTFSRFLSANIGSISAYSNGGDGVYAGGQLMHINMLIGDNNDVLFDGNGNDQSSYRIDAFRSERWGDAPRHNVIFRLSMRGGCVNIGSGYVHVGNVQPGIA